MYIHMYMYTYIYHYACRTRGGYIRGRTCPAGGAAALRGAHLRYANLCRSLLPYK